MDEEQAVDQKLSEVYSRMMNTLWMVLTSGESKWVDQLEVCETEYQSLLTSSATTEWIGYLEKHSNSQARRQALILTNERLELSGDERLRSEMSTLWNELHYVISTHRTQIDGALLSEREVRTGLRTLMSEERRQEIWQRYMAIGEKVAPGLLQLVRMRNQVAKEKGFADFFEMKLFSQEVDWNEIADQITQLRGQLDRDYRVAKEKVDRDVLDRYCKLSSQIQPWHYTHPFIAHGYTPESPMMWDISQLSDRLSVWLARAGIIIKHTLKSADWLGRSGKSQANCCLNIDRGNDIRVMGNVDSNHDGLRLYLHEIGHAVYESQIDRQLPFALRQPAHIFLSEAVALLFERLKEEDVWLQKMGIGSNVCNLARKVYRDQRLMRLYWTMTVVKFERELYRNPEGPLNEIWWREVEAGTGMTRPDNWNYPYWAAIAHLTTLPVYYYNYLFGEIASAQLRQSLDAQWGCWFGGESLAHIRDTIYRPGASRSWKELLEDCTGSNLSSDGIINDFIISKGC